MRATFFEKRSQQVLERDGFVVIPFLSGDAVKVLHYAYSRLGRAPGVRHRQAAP